MFDFFNVFLGHHNIPQDNMACSDLTTKIGLLKEKKTGIPNLHNE
jgi:hypothetical protein